MIAAAHRISPYAVAKGFEDEQGTVAARIHRCRLERCRADLVRTDRTVTAVVARW
jgi:hypothetical protein